MTAWKRAVARAFDGAEGYDRAARVQAVVAERLAAIVAEQRLAASPCTLEIGCGTGFLTQALRGRIAVGRMLATDIAPAMLDRCRARLGSAGDLHFAVMDGERPGVAEGFDLVVSSLAAQWFVDLEGALGQLSRLLRPGGLLAVSTLAAGTFREWGEAQTEAGLTAVMPACPSRILLRQMRFAGCTSEIRLDHLRERHADGAAFLRALKSIGAHIPAEQAAFRSAGDLRRALRIFEAGGAHVTYAVATCLIRRAEGPVAPDPPDEFDDRP